MMDETNLEPTFDARANGYHERCFDGTWPLVYLCGTITPDPKYLNWRVEATERLHALDIKVLNPVRWKNPEDWTADGLEGTSDVPYSEGGFVARDQLDIERADALLLRFMDEPGRQSIGTWTEFGMAVEQRKMIVVVSDLPTVVKHPFVYKLATRVVATLDEGVRYLDFLFA